MQSKTLSISIDDARTMYYSGDYRLKRLALKVYKENEIKKPFNTIIEQKQEWDGHIVYILADEHSFLSLLISDTERWLNGDNNESVDVREAWINKIYVDKEYRHQGLATKLLNRAEEIVKKEGFDEVYGTLNQFKGETYLIAREMLMNRGFVPTEPDDPFCTDFVKEYYNDDNCD
jgi:GNAT superfamily N-acetyltransferase